MSDSPLQLALREVRQDLTSPKGAIGLMAVGILIGISGPFETFAFLPLVPRVLYWTLVVIVTYSVGAVLNIYLSNRFKAALTAVWLRLAVYGMATGLAVFAIVTLINTAVFGWPYATVGSVAASFALICVISTIISGLAMVFRHDASGTDIVQTPPLLDRLPLDKRGGLVSLSVQDHYVNVTTTQGQEMLLMRLSDAIKETAPTEGLQIHRSHWVARDQIAAAERRGDRAVLTLKSGAEVPASRSYIPALRDAGILPKVGRG